MKRLACSALSVVILSFQASEVTAQRGLNVTSSLVPARILAAHNASRSEVGVAPLEWDNALGMQAARYAMQLALSNRFEHSNPKVRNGTGENLWMGTRGAFSVKSMFADWASERSYFRPGVFPLVSRTGNWRDVGHYTQIVWPTTRKVGCALATNARADYLVCHYSPAGNVQGVVIHPARARFAAR